MCYFENIEKLKQSYRNIMNKKGSSPEWAVHKSTEQDKLVSCTIPFVGREYFEEGNKRILVYASAEVLSDYAIGNENGRPWLEDDEIALNRHRIFYDKESNNNKFFPDIHIQPMTDGALFTAVLYIAIKLGIVHENINVREFYERIAVGNYCKYTKETERQYNYRNNGVAEGEKANIDYTKLSAKEARKYLEESHPYLIEDIRILQPDLIILPEMLYNKNKEFLNEITKGIKKLPIYQMNRQPINMTIAKTLNYERKEIGALPEIIKTCYLNLNANGFTGKTKENYRAVFSYLDDKIK